MFKHEHFVRGQHERLRFIQRRGRVKKRQYVPVRTALPSPALLSSPTELSLLRYIHLLRDELQIMRNSQQRLELRLGEMELRLASVLGMLHHSGPFPSSSVSSSSFPQRMPASFPLEGYPLMTPDEMSDMTSMHGRS